MSTSVTDSPTQLLEAQDLIQEFTLSTAGIKGGVFQALAGVSISVGDGETVGVVGETGCGKSTLARAILQSPVPTSGKVLFQGTNLVGLKGKALRDTRRHLQMVFQDPYSSLDPRWSVAELIEEPMNNYKIGAPDRRRTRSLELLELCGLDPDRYAKRSPRQLSGGQCQRVAIARALSISPELLICDEALSSLDVSIQGQIINLLEDLREQLGLAYLFIAHDLTVVQHLSNRVAVMYLGKIVEVGPADDVCERPYHHYTSALLAAAPDFDDSDARADGRGTAEISGETPSPLDPPSGCRFRTRCPRAEDLCALEEPPLRAITPGHSVACHFPLMEVAS